MDSSRKMIGSLSARYYFLVSVANLVETKSDESPIIDSKDGAIKGSITYSIGLEVLDPVSGVALNLLNYDNINDIVDKKLKITVELKKSYRYPREAFQRS